MGPLPRVHRAMPEATLCVAVGGRVFVVCRACVAIQARRAVVRYCRAQPSQCPLLLRRWFTGARRALPRSWPTATHNVASGIARWTRGRGPKSVPEFTANAFDDHHRRIGAVSRGRPKSLNPWDAATERHRRHPILWVTTRSKAEATVVSSLPGMAVGYSPSCFR